MQADLGHTHFPHATPSVHYHPGHGPPPRERGREGCGNSRHCFVGLLLLPSTEGSRTLVGRDSNPRHNLVSLRKLPRNMHRDRPGGKDGLRGAPRANPDRRPRTRPVALRRSFAPPPRSLPCYPTSVVGGHLNPKSPLKPSFIIDPENVQAISRHFG